LFYVQTLLFEREPTNAEIEEAVQSDLILLEDEAAEQKRQKVAPSTSTLVVQGAQNLHGCVEVLESFMSK